MPPRNTPTGERSWQVVLPAALHRVVETYQSRHRLTRSEAIRELVAAGVGDPSLAEISRGRPPENKGGTTTSGKS